MTIAEIRTALNARLGKSEETDAINAEVQLAVEDLSKLATWPDLRTTGNLSFTADDKSKAFATGFRVFDDAVISGYRPLQLARYRDIKNVQESQSPTKSRPLWCAPRGKSLFVYPIPDGNYTVVVGYYRVHPTIGTEAAPTISFGDEFTQAVIFRTIVQYLLTSKMTKHPKLKENMDLYAREVGLLLPQADREVVITKPWVYGVN